MAFTTQSEFFNVPLINETIENECRNNTVKVQSYESAADLRLWDISEKQHSRFLTNLRSRNPTLGLDFDTDASEENKSVEQKRKQRGQSELVYTFRGQRCSSIGPYETQRRSYEKEKKTGFKRSKSSRAGRTEHERSNKRKEDSRKANRLEDNEDNGFLSFRSLKSGGEYESGPSNKFVTEKRSVYSEIDDKGIENSDVPNLNLSSDLDENSAPNNKNNQSSDGWSSDTDIEPYDDSKRTQNNERVIFERVIDIEVQDSQPINEDSSPKSQKSDYNRLADHRRELGGFIGKCAFVSEAGNTTQCSKSTQPTSSGSSAKSKSQHGSSPCRSPKTCVLERMYPKASACEKKPCSKRGKDNIAKNATLQGDTSLVRVANITMANLEKIIKEKSYLQEQLVFSNQCLTETTTERNELRKRLKAFKEMEAKIAHLQVKAKNAGHVTGDIKENLFRQAKYIENMEEELVKTQNYYEEKIKALMSNEQALHRRSCSLKEELVRTRCEAMKVEPLQKEITELCYEIKTLQEALSEYDCQYKELIQVVEELQASNTPAESSEFIEDLAYFTSTTLLEIKKEMENRNVLGMGDSKGCIEKQHLEQQYVEELKTENCKLHSNMIDIQKDCEKICAQAIDKLKQLQNENEKLKKSHNEIIEKNKDLGIMFEMHRQSLSNLDCKVVHLDKEMEKTSTTAFQMMQTIEKSQELVQEIVKVREENEKLASTIDLLQKEDSSHEIKDLKRKLEEALNNLEKCKEENNEFKEKLKETMQIKSNRKQSRSRCRSRARDHCLESYRSTSVGDNMDLPVKRCPSLVQESGAECENISSRILSASRAPDYGQESRRNEYDTANEDEEKHVSCPKTQSAKKVHIDVAEDVAPKTDRSVKACKQLSPKRKQKDCRNLNLVKNTGAYDEFVAENASKMKSKVNFGSSFVRELRAILDAFISECGFCFCKDCIPKSRFYATCHKILHRGIQNVNFNDLAYMQKKLYKAIEKLQPGWLLQSMLSEQLGPDGLKCCNCKNILCCTNSEEMLKEKVTKLERDIEMAREYLENLKACPSNTHSVNGNLNDGQDMAPMKR